MRREQAKRMASYLTVKQRRILWEMHMLGRPMTMPHVVAELRLTNVVRLHIDQATNTSWPRQSLALLLQRGLVAERRAQWNLEAAGERRFEWMYELTEDGSAVAALCYDDGRYATNA